MFSNWALHPEGWGSETCVHLLMKITHLLSLMRMYDRAWRNIGNKSPFPSRTTLKVLVTWIRSPQWQKTCTVPSPPPCSESFPSGVGSGCPSSGGGGTAGRTRTLPANMQPGGTYVSQSGGSSEWTMRSTAGSSANLIGYCSLQGPVNTCRKRATWERPVWFPSFTEDSNLLSQNF